MNERIKQLYAEAKQATKIDTMNAPAGVVAEKFAELIIRECYETCKDNLVNESEAQAFGLTYNDAVGDCAIQIKTHFGVE